MQGHGMKLRFSPTLLKSALVLLLATLGPLVNAQPAGQLYDPEPPADSAYVRVIVASRGSVVDVMVDGRPRIAKLKSGEPGDYMVLAAGKHSIAIHAAGKPTAQVSTTLDVVRGRAMTIAFTTLLSDAEPILFEDKANSNKLKSMLAVYNLDSKSGPLDLLTADGNTKVFVGVAHGAPVSIQVNPISVELIAAKTGDKTPLARVSLSMTQGGTYSVFLLPTEGGKLSALAAQNKTERYTGK
jgi:alginate O-acetyltransferase complex protein AlgF